MPRRAWRLRPARSAVDERRALLAPGRQAQPPWCLGHRHPRHFRTRRPDRPGSYGLLYVWDDESNQHPNEFRVFKLARGRVTEHSDVLLSPVIPALEDVWRDETATT